MVRIITTISIVLILSSCGARKKITNKSTEESKLETSSISNVHIDKLNDISTNIKTINNLKELQFSVTPLIVDTTGGHYTQEVILETPEGKQTKIKYPKNSSINFNTKDSQENKTEDKKDKSQTKVNKKEKSKAKSSVKNTNKSTDLKKDEPVIFNRTLAIVIGIIFLLLIIAAFIYYKIIKRNTKPL